MIAFLKRLVLVLGILPLLAGLAVFYIITDDRDKTNAVMNAFIDWCTGYKP